MIELRPIEPADGEECARIVYEAFGGLHDHHQFARDFPTLDAALQLTGMFIEHPSIWGIVAERDGRILGSNFLDERGPIRGVGPVSVDPAAQGQGVGRRLMEAVLERGEGARGIRLLQDSFNVQSLSLYASLGFDVKELAVVMSGRPRSGPAAGIDVRPLEESDLDTCESLCQTVHGFERTNELRDALGAPVFSPLVALRDGRLTAWATTFAFFPAACAVAETENDMRAVILGALAADEAPASFLLPTRQAGLFRWCLREGTGARSPQCSMPPAEVEPATWDQAQHRHRGPPGRRSRCVLNRLGDTRGDVPPPEHRPKESRDEGRGPRIGPGRPDAGRGLPDARPRGHAGDA